MKHFASEASVSLGIVNNAVNSGPSLDTNKAKHHPSKEAAKSQAILGKLMRKDKICCFPSSCLLVFMAFINFFNGRAALRKKEKVQT